MQVRCKYFEATAHYIKCLKSGLPLIAELDRCSHCKENKACWPGRVIYVDDVREKITKNLCDTCQPPTDRDCKVTDGDPILMCIHYKSTNQPVIKEQYTTHCEIPNYGVKYDDGKLKWSLLPILPIEAIIRVLMSGAKKYSPDNWKYVKQPKERYYDACMRHLTAWQRGERDDAETGSSHLAHAGCCLIFLLYFEIVGYKDE